ncbi:hypothetical protein CsSME_00013088 [Camellia sinensis var. sinensis]
MFLVRLGKKSVKEGSCELQYCKYLDCSDHTIDFFWREIHWIDIDDQGFYTSLAYSDW